MGNETSTQAGSSSPPIPNDVKLKWEQVSFGNGVVPRAREGHVVNIVDNRYLVLFGGGYSSEQTGPAQSSETFAFDLENGTWKELTQNTPPAARTGAACASIGKRVFLFGGFNPSLHGWLDTLHIMDLSNGIDNSSWTLATTDGDQPSPRDKAAVCCIGNKIYLFGGFGPQELPDDESDEEEQDDEEMGEAATFGWFNDIYVLDTDTLIWTELSPSGTPPTPRAATGIAAAGNKIYIWGGRDNQQRTNDLHILDVDANTWVPNVSQFGAVPTPRSFHTLTALSNTSDSKLVLFGGLNRASIHMNDVHVFDTATNAWITPTIEGISMPIARGFHGAALGANKLLYIFGGSSDFDASTQECKTYHGDMWRVDTTQALDAKISVSSEPSH